MDADLKIFAINLIQNTKCRVTLRLATTLIWYTMIPRKKIVDWGRVRTNNRYVDEPCKQRIYHNQCHSYIYQDWKLNNTLLATRITSDRHTGINIARELKKIADEFGLGGVIALV